MKIKNSKAFTLLEVLISIMLLSLVLMALYKSAEILRNSNKNLYNHLEKTSNALKGAKTLYMDLLQSDGNITIKNKEKKFDRVTFNTNHSLYGLSIAQVSWLVYKENNTLLRLEGGEYNIPLKDGQNVAIDAITQDIELFKVYKSKKKSDILVIIKLKGEDTQTFMVQNITTPKTKEDRNRTTPQQDRNISNITR